MVYNIYNKQLFFLDINIQLTTTLFMGCVHHFKNRLKGRLEIPYKIQREKLLYLLLSIYNKHTGVIGLL